MKPLFVECKSRRTAKKKYPQAEKTVKVHGGYLIFTSIQDYLIWRRQK